MTHCPHKADVCSAYDTASLNHSWLCPVWLFFLLNYWPSKQWYTLCSKLSVDVHILIFEGGRHCRWQEEHGCLAKDG
jgi:hypothetical protein